MAKKKSNAQSQSQSQAQAQENSNDKPTKTVEEAPSMEEEEKLNPKKELASLKALNAMLLKETVERRQQVDSLIVSNGSLESELTRSEMEKKALRDELNRLSDQAVMLEIEGGLVSSFVSEQGKQQAEVVGVGDGEGTVEMKEKMESLESEMKRLLGEKGEIEKEVSDKEMEIWMLKRRVDELAVEIVEKRGVSIRAAKERDVIKAKLDNQIEETIGLIEKLKEAEDREMEIANEVEKLKMEIAEAKEDKERSIKLILSEKELVERRLAESENEIEELRRKIEELLMEKKVMEEKSGEGEREKNELANTVSGLNEMIEVLKNEGEMLRGNVADLEKRYGEALEKERQKVTEIDGLLEEKNEREKMYESLILEKDSTEKRLVESEKEIKNLGREIDELLREKKMIEERTGLGEKERQELADTVSGLNEMIKSLKHEGQMLRGSVTDLEKRCAEALEKERQKEVEIDGILEEKREREKSFETLNQKKDLIERRLTESEKEIEELRTEIDALLREKKMIEEKTGMVEMEKHELGSTVSTLNETITSLKDEGEILRGNLADLEMRCAEGLEKERQIGTELDGLLEEKNERAKIFENLLHEKSLLMSDLNETKTSLNIQMQKLEQISLEKIELEEAKSRGESEIVELKKQLREFQDTIHSQEESSLGQIDKLKQLESEVSHYRAAFDKATTEKTKADEALNEEKVNRMKLREQISEMEKFIQQMEKRLSEMEAESANLNGEKNELESRCSLLRETITSLENQLAESQNEHNDIKAKVGLANANTERVLNMLGNTASLISPSTNVLERSIGTENFVFAHDNKGDEEDVKPYVEKLEAIQRAFEVKESTIAEMKRQLELHENSVAAAHKGKNFWTVVSSATVSATIIAAAFIAYVSRPH